MPEERGLREWQGEQGWDAGGAGDTTGRCHSDQHCLSALQFFKMGIAMCFIEMRGSTIREAKSRSFELITPSKTFRYPGVPGGMRREEQMRRELGPRAACCSPLLKKKKKKRGKN